METKLTKLEHLTATMRAARAFIQGLVAQVAQAAADDIAAAQSVADTAHTTAQNAKSTADAAKNAADSAKAAAVVMKGATSSAAGAAGLTPAPAAGAQGKYLRGDGTWQTPPNTTYAAATQSSNGLLSAADKKKLDGVTAGANAYSLPAASASARGGVKIGYTANGKNYPVQLSNEQMYVNVPWTDTNTTYSNMGAATASAAGKAGLVPAPAAGAQAKYLRGDGTWQTPPDTNTTYTPASATPKAAGTAAVGKSAKYAREDHVHPAQTAVSGNAGTATKLATPRAINGTNFDGSAAVTTTKWGTARNITIGNKTKSVDGSGNVSWTLDEIGASAPFVAQNTAPANTKILWIDTTAGTGGLKYHNGSAWVHVPVAYN